MRHARIMRGGLGLVLASGIASAGCTHNYYYGALPACGPTTTPAGTVQYGQVCEVPTQVVGGGSVLSQVPARSSIVGPRPPRVVISEPTGSGGGLWRRSDPESSLATTRVEGALDDPTVNR
jgi:hypothetical protein